MSAFVGPTLGYRDARAAIRFLVTAFGFEEVAVYEGEKGTVDHAELRWPGGGGVMVHTAESGGNSVADLSAKAAADGGFPAFSVHVSTNDPDALFKRAITTGASVVREVVDSPFGTRGFIVRDPEGLYWSFGTTLPKLVRGADGQWHPPTRAGKKAREKGPDR